LRVGLYSDNTLPLDLSRFCAVLNDLCGTVSFERGTHPFRLVGQAIRSPVGDRTFEPSLLEEMAGFDMCCLATNVPYDNNHFFHAIGNNSVVSFNGWNYLTDLPIPNGFAYFIASILAHQVELGETHEENRGCLNDFWWDKTGVNVGMRAAFICPDCLRIGSKDDRVLADIKALLYAVSVASREGTDLLETLFPEENVIDDGFDVFLCHNSEDKPAVREINKKMKAVGLKTWLDEEQLPLGVFWQPELETAIESIRGACVFVGPSGFGPWQSAEIRAILNKFASSNQPVTPVLLPGSQSAPELPLFLRDRTWSDLRTDDQESLDRLLTHMSDSAKRPSRALKKSKFVS
jgi:hypothetical protein